METLDEFQRVEAQLRTTTLSRSHEEYLAQNIEVRELLHDVLQAVLVHKPEDPIGFIQTYCRNMKSGWAGIDAAIKPATSK